jgi:hypothetical protein
MYVYKARGNERAVGAHLASPASKARADVHDDSIRYRNVCCARWTAIAIDHSAATDHQVEGIHVSTLLRSRQVSIHALCAE